MTSVQQNKTYEGKTDTEIYEAAIQAIPNAGLKVWKKRELARLVLGNGEVDGHEVRCNIVVSMVDGSVTISAEADDLSQDALQKVVDKLANELDKLVM
jgi:ribosome-associated translation inhibitor RaiA